MAYKITSQSGLARIQREIESEFSVKIDAADAANFRKAATMNLLAGRFGSEIRIISNSSLPAITVRRGQVVYNGRVYSAKEYAAL